MAGNNFFSMLEKKYKVTKVQLLLFMVLLIWSSAVFLLLRSALATNPYSIITWTSLSTFFTGFSSLVLIIIAVLLVNKTK